MPPWQVLRTPWNIVIRTKYGACWRETLHSASVHSHYASFSGENVKFCTVDWLEHRPCDPHSHSPALLMS
jgi:hypothetical protein